MIRFLLPLLLLALTVQHAAAERIVTLSGAVTETVVALGLGDQIVAVDTSSTHPAAVVGALPKVGYHRQLSAEGILALKPTLVLATTDAGPKHAIDQLRTSGVKVEILPAPHSLEGTLSVINGVGKAVGREADTTALADGIAARVAEIRARIPESAAKPRVLFIYARGGGVMNVAGKGTSAHELITLAGGENAGAALDGYKPLTSEALVIANPDVILMLDAGLKAAGGPDAVLAIPGVSLTKAGQQKRIIHLDDQLALGFGPRLAEGVAALATQLHPEAKAVIAE